jgi:N6-L-threonylcarbamoyladenine synthase
VRSFPDAIPRRTQTFPSSSNYSIVKGIMRVLAIETSCDETGIALLSVSGGGLKGRAAVTPPRVEVRESLVASQIALHREFGGVVPNLAKREHLRNLPLLYARLEKKLRAKGSRLAFDMITVTVGPGLEPALWTGINFAEALAAQTKKTLVGANHLEGHLYSFILPSPRAKRTPNAKAPAAQTRAARPTAAPVAFPAIALIVSGGHTTLLRMDSLVQWKLLGETRDDAAGEAFDKAARLIGLPYPGGPEIERLARIGDPHMAEFPRPMIHEKNYDFSFSGLKTAVLYYVRDNPSVLATEEGRAGVAASFQAAAIDVLVAKTVRAARESGARSVILCGGVAANTALRNALARAVRHAMGPSCAFLVPARAYNLDNAAMIGLAGYMAKLRDARYPLRADGSMEV